MTNLEMLKIELSKIIKKETLKEADWIKADKLVRVIEEIEEGRINEFEVGDDDILEYEGTYLTNVDSDKLI